MDGHLFPFLLYPVPHFFRDNGFLLSPDRDLLPLVLLIHAPVRPAVIYNLPAVKRIVQDTGGKIPVIGAGASSGNPPVPVVIQPPHYCGKLHIRFQILGINQPDNLRFPRLNSQLPVLIPIPERRRSACPASLHHLLHPSGHKLHPDVLPFNLRHSGQDRDGQSSALGGTVNTVFHTYQIHIIVQKRLDGFQHIRGVPSEPAQLKHQHIRDLILSAGDIVHHLHKGRPSQDALPRFSGVTVFARDFKVLIFRVLAQAFLLSFQAVAFRLGGRGNTGINVTFLFHVLTSFGCSLSYGSPCMINISESGIPANSQDAQGFSLKTMRNAQKKPTVQMTAGKDVVSCLFLIRNLCFF